MANRKERVFNCPDCGVEVVTKYSRTARCVECAKKRTKELKRRWHVENEHLRVRQRVADKGFYELQCCDTPKNVQKCLNCKKPKCTNCLGYAYTKETEGGAGR
jgi:hypothetical protein